MSIPARGLSLIELLVVLVVIAATLSLGLPSLRGLLHSTRLEAESKRLFSAINLARSESVLRNTPVSICPSSMAASGTATCGGTFADGWVVFVNPDRDRIIEGGAAEVLQIYHALPPGYSVTNKAGTRAVSALINYLPDGSAHRNQTLRVCAPGRPVAQGMSIVLNIVGRARLDRHWGACLGVS